MLGGGEQFFQEPPGFTIETLKHYAAFAACLRSVEDIKGSTIQQACALAKAVGNDEASFELVVGLLFRHIKTWTAKRQLAGWYILHQLCRDEPDKYAHEANKYIMEVGCDYIPWENAELAPKYQALVQKWNTDRLFSPHVIQKIWQSQVERAEQKKNPARYRQELLDEEAVWKEEDIRHQTIDGKLNDFGQPCLDYLQGNCTWGNNCKMLHPPGQQGTLPPECRLGDWKCPCGTINRHFRRRCSNCPKEKPQYRRTMQLSAEDRLLSQPEDMGDLFKHQFGFDPNNVDEAVKFWTQRLAAYSTQQWREERSDAYRTRILGKGNNNSSGGSTVTSSTALNFPSQPLAEDVVPDEIVPASKKHRAEGAARQALAAHHNAIISASQRVRLPNLPSMQPAERVPFIARKIIDSGISDGNLGEMLYLLSISIRAVATMRGGLAANIPPTHFEPFYTVATLVYAGWNNGKARTVAVPFFEDIRPYLFAAGADGLVGDGAPSDGAADALTAPTVPKECYGQLVAIMPPDQIANLRTMAKDVTGKSSA